MRPKIHRSSLTLAWAMLLSLGWLCTSEAQLLPITTRVITINNLAVAALRHPTTRVQSQNRDFHHAPDGSYVNNVACTQLAVRAIRLYARIAYFFAEVRTITVTNSTPRNRVGNKLSQKPSQRRWYCNREIHCLGPQCGRTADGLLSECCRKRRRGLPGTGKNPSLRCQHPRQLAGAGRSDFSRCSSWGRVSDVHVC